MKHLLQFALGLCLTITFSVSINAQEWITLPDGSIYQSQNTKMTISGDTLRVNGGMVVMPADQDGDDTNELQSLGITGNKLSISMGNDVDLPIPVIPPTTNTLTATGSAITSTVDGVVSTYTPPAGATVSKLGFNAAGNLVKDTATNTSVQVLFAKGTVSLGDPVVAGARTVSNAFNVGGAAGLDGTAADTRFRVDLATPYGSGDYVISGHFTSVTAANWNNDNDLVWTVVSKSSTSFVIAVKELSAGAQNVNFSFEIYKQGTVTGNVYTAGSGIAITNGQVSVVSPSILPEAAGLVAIGTAVSLDNISISPNLTSASAGNGFLVGTVSTPATLTVTVLSNYGGVGNGISNAVYAGNRANFSATTTLTHPLNYAGNTEGDMIFGLIHDKTAGKVYSFTVLNQWTPTLSYVKIKREI